MFMCPSCGKKFDDPAHPDRKFCSHSCSKRDYWRRRETTFTERFWARVEKSDGCWIWRGQLSAVGYGKLRYQTVSELAHRVAWMLIRGKIPHGLAVLHHCDVRACVNPSHLWLGTRGENNTDRAAKGRSATGTRNGNTTHPEKRPRGEQHAATKLTEEQVRGIRRLHAEGIKPGALAKQYRVTPWNIYDIVSNRTWRHLG